MFTPMENFNKLPIRQGNRKNVNLSEQLKSVMGCTVSIPIIIKHAVIVINATEHNSAKTLSVLSKRQVVAAIR